jgi:WD40 repeat protein
MQLHLTVLILQRDHLILLFVSGMQSLGMSFKIPYTDNRTEKAVLMGHTSLVGQIQMRGNTLVTGGSDGSVRVWDLEKLRCVTRMAAHDNSVTSLQFDDKIIVTGGSDGYVKVRSP